MSYWRTSVSVRLDWGLSVREVTARGTSAVGVSPGASGCVFGCLDLDFYFDTEPEARAAEARLREEFGRRVEYLSVDAFEDDGEEATDAKT